MKYYVIEHQIRPDGEVNISETARQNLNSALSLYHERFSKMAMNVAFKSVALMLVDENLNVIDHHIVNTMWKPEEVEEPAEETPEVLVENA